MALFSQRYGYIKPAEAFIREQMTEEIQNAICTVFDLLDHELPGDANQPFSFERLEWSVWCNFLNRRRNEALISGYGVHVTYSIAEFIQSTEEPWFRKLDLVEFCMKTLWDLAEGIAYQQTIVINGIKAFNHEFERLNFAYRFVNFEIVEINSKEEIIAIEEAINSSKDAVKTHLSTALQEYAKRPNPDYRNSIKESISAVESVSREITGETTLGAALNKLEKRDVTIQAQLKDAFIKMYAYTNQPTTGIRHALMYDAKNYTPASDETYFMIVACSAFVNYLRRKSAMSMIV